VYSSCIARPLFKKDFDFKDMIRKNASKKLIFFSAQKKNQARSARLAETCGMWVLKRPAVMRMIHVFLNT
jgi:hypothetical protein